MVVRKRLRKIHVTFILKDTTNFASRWRRGLRSVSGRGTVSEAKLLLSIIGFSCRPMSNESGILAVRVDETQLRLLSRELCCWKIQHNDVN